MDRFSKNPKSLEKLTQAHRKKATSEEAGAHWQAIFNDDAKIEVQNSLLRWLRRAANNWTQATLDEWDEKMGTTKRGG